MENVSISLLKEVLKYEQQAAEVLAKYKAGGLDFANELLIVQRKSITLLLVDERQDKIRLYDEKQAIKTEREKYVRELKEVQDDYTKQSTRYALYQKVVEINKKYIEDVAATSKFSELEKLVVANRGKLHLAYFE